MFLCKHNFSAPSGKFQGGQLFHDMSECFHLVKKSSNPHSEWPYCSACPPAMSECSLLQTLTGACCWGLRFGCCSRYGAVSHCCLNFHFPDDSWCGTSFHLLTSPVCVCVFGKVLLRSLVHFSIELFFLLLSIKSSLCILSFTDVFSANISSTLWLVFS